VKVEFVVVARLAPGLLPQLVGPADDIDPLWLVLHVLLTIVTELPTNPSRSFPDLIVGSEFVGDWRTVVLEVTRERDGSATAALAGLGYHRPDHFSAF
jgi:hypothetical protein